MSDRAGRDDRSDRGDRHGTGASAGRGRGVDHEQDVDEALALVREASVSHTGGTPHEAPRQQQHQQHQQHQQQDQQHEQQQHQQKHSHRHRATPWPRARAVAGRAAEAVVARAAKAAAAPGARPDTPRGTGSSGSGAGRTPVAVPLDRALGLVLAAPLTALTDLPSFDTSAMDGWAVAGPGPWKVRAEGVLAGHSGTTALGDGEAVRIATGARVPREVTAVIRSEHGRTDSQGRLHPQREVMHGQDIRPRGQECRSGDHLLPARTPVTPAVLGLAAAAGYDTLLVVPRPRVEVLVLGDELLTEGLPREGLIRDALGPMLPSWLRGLGAEVIAVRRLGDDAKALRKAVAKSPAELVITTGGTASGPVDHVHPTLEVLGAELLVDGVQVRPGHPMLLARLDERRHLVGLPGNPLAAVSGLLTLAEPVLRTLSGRIAPEPYLAPTRDEIHGHPHDTRLVPVVLRAEPQLAAVPLHYNGPAMLRGIAASDGLAVVPPGGAKPGQELEILDLPWTLPLEGLDPDSAGSRSGTANRTTDRTTDRAAGRTAKDTDSGDSVDSAGGCFT
ncbi:molybdopterin molybdotransferase MoeA [Streptomyces boluensis]|uniref:Molybdopterin molybdenumtransferase n=1 Tax=Streptomyces boluensis TaxID=1775135 RepID=A0A964XM60_9ACTN|nr:molybdopterin molybdotransferase MoeA [Streptomyces boluensis]NBE52238.1 molybdopterin molybdenumtransferase MoeA [Streptomyces boluensis]